MKALCSMKQQLTVISISLLLISNSLYSQIKTEDCFEVFDNTIKLEKEELTKVAKECDAVVNLLTMSTNSNQVFVETICTADIEDVRFTQKGYLTIVEHYSSPVGWTVYYIFDLCKSRLIKTKRIDEGVKLIWNDFIDPNNVTKKNYIEKIHSTRKKIIWGKKVNIVFLKHKQ